MAVRYEPLPGVPGAFNAIDDDAGLNRVVYDPSIQQSAPAAPPDMSAPTPTPTTAGLDPDVAGALSDSIPQGPPPAPMPGAVPPASPQAVAMAGAAQPVFQPRMYSGNAPPAQAPPGPGMVLSKAAIKPGVSAQPYNQAAEDARGEKLLDRNLDLQKRSDATTSLLNDQAIQLGKQQQDDQQRQQIAEAKASRYENELNTTVRTELDPARLIKSEGIGGAILGLVGMAIAGFNKAPGLAMSRMNSALDARISRDINIQKEEKDSKIAVLTRQLGSADQAAAQYRASVRQAAFDRLGMQLKAQGVYGQYQDLMQAGRDELDTLNEQARQASYGKPGAAEYTYSIPKPVKGEGATQAQAIGALPPGAEQYQQTELAKSAAARGEKPEKTQAAYKAWADEHAKGAPLEQALNDAESALKPFEGSNDVAGKGLIAGKFPLWLKSEEGRHVSQQLAVATEQVTKEMHGVRIPPETMKRVHDMVEGNGTYDDLKFGLEAIHRSLQAGYRELDASEPTFARIHGHVSGLVAASKADQSGGKAAQDAMRNRGATQPASVASEQAPSTAGSDPVKDIKRKGLSKWLSESGEDGDPAGDAL